MKIQTERTLCDICKCNITGSPKKIRFYPELSNGKIEIDCDPEPMYEEKELCDSCYYKIQAILTMLHVPWRENNSPFYYANLMEINNFAFAWAWPYNLKRSCKTCKFSFASSKDLEVTSCKNLVLPIRKSREENFYCSLWDPRE